MKHKDKQDILKDNHILYHDLKNKNKNIKKIILSKLISDEDIKKREGTWFKTKDMKHGIVNYNCDVYYKDNSGKEILLGQLTIFSLK